jgi:hypothetical protein
MLLNEVAFATFRSGTSESKLVEQQNIQLMLVAFATFHWNASSLL